MATHIHIHLPAQAGILPGNALAPCTQEMFTAVTAGDFILPAEIGAPFEGGFFGGLYLEGARPMCLVVAPKAEGEFEGATWGNIDAPGATSMVDGLANTRALLVHEHPATRRCAELRIAGKDDWHLPAINQLGVLRDTLFPRDGITPAQTSADAFKEGASEAFAQAAYWSSTQYSAGSAWGQHFLYGNQYGYDKDWSCRVRAVRKVRL